MQATPAKFEAHLPVAENNANLRNYIHIVMERRWLAISAFLVALVLTAIYLAQAKPVFQAVARLQINKESDNPLTGKDSYTDARYEMDYLQTQYKNLQSRTLLGMVIDQLALTNDARYAKSLDPIARLSRDVTISPVRLSRLVDVKVEHTRPERAALIANTIGQLFISNNVAQKQMSSSDALNWLTQQEATTREKVEAADTKLQEYRLEKNEVSLEDNDNLVRQSLFGAKAELSRAHMDVLQADETLAEIDRILADGKPIESIPQIRDSLVLQRLQQELGLRESALAALLTRYRDKHPSVIQARGEIEKMRDAIKQESQFALQALRNNAVFLKKREEALLVNVEQETAKQQALYQLRIEYDALKRESDNSKTIYSNVLLRRNETELLSRLSANNMVLVDPAPTPTGPIKPKVILTVIFGVFAGLVAGIGLAFFVNYLDDSIKSQDDVENTLGLAFLGYVPNIKTNSVVERDLQAHSHPQSNAAEGFRTIRATLSLTHKPEKLRLVSVTSTIPSEGKSLVASNLAIVSAQTGLRTLLVDADLRRPSVHKAFQLHSPIGLSAFLTGDTADLEDITHKTEVPNLDVICCGSVPTNPSELIGSARMKAFLDLVSDKYDRIVLDCPPISAVSDPLVIAAKTDGVVFVCKFNKIRREHARRSVQRIQAAGIHIMGVVINDIDFEGKDSYYYSYYYYQNRYYSSHYKTTPDKADKETTKS
ncbi:MAG TPA: polysaccharide biosynthesis tyrosine autokinase [Verrucomicrobiae bacterium]